MFDFINKLLGKSVVNKPTNLISNQAKNHGTAATLAPTVNRTGVGIALSNFETVQNFLKKKKKANHATIARAKKIEHAHKYHLKNGIKFDPVDHVLEFSYNGLLAASGAENVHIHIGFDDNNKWSDPKEYPMHKVGESKFKAYVPVKKGNFYFAFRDTAHNWDNNSKLNYHGIFPLDAADDSSANEENTQNAQNTLNTLKSSN